jgi:hypothetical protein
MSLVQSSKKLFKKHLTPSKYTFVENKYRFVRKYIFKIALPLSPLFQNDLVSLATLYGTDKWNSHWYAQHYQKHFYPLRQKN